MATLVPVDHPQRRELNDEVHARPPEALAAPLRLSFLALHSDWASRDREWQHVGALLERFGRPVPASAGSHLSIDLGPFRLKWERHTEFTRYKFIVPGEFDDPFDPPAIDRVPADWVAAIPGQVLAACHVGLVRDATERLDHEALAVRHFAGNVLIGSKVAGGLATALTDLRIHGDRFSRLLVLDRGMAPRQAGRMIQRLLEIDTYRMLALLAFPVARELSPVLQRWDQELVDITDALTRGEESEEPMLLDRLTRLEAEIDRMAAKNDYRFSAAQAYYALVERRIRELREERIQGLQTFEEFTERRLAPAMSTCRSAAARQEVLSQRVARTTELLATRVGITRERQNRAVLESMNRRAMLQLRLQETVEGLSVAAVTYYVVGLVAYLTKGLLAAGVSVRADLVTGISIPLVAIAVALGVRRLRKRIARGIA
jgi:uncharacterized membrane-anchored protein